MLYLTFFLFWIIILRNRVFALAFFFAVLLFFTSCSKSAVNSKYSEVSFKNEIEICFEYNFQSFNGIVSFNEGVLIFKYSDNCGVMSGSEVVINESTYKFTNNGLTFEGSTETLSEKFLPKLLFEFIKTNNGLVNTEMFDKTKLCFYLEDSCFSSFIRFEVYENANINSYVMVITWICKNHISFTEMWFIFIFNLIFL